MKEQIRNWIIKLIGYPMDVQNLLDYIDTFEGDICIYPGGKFRFAIRSSDNQEDKPMIFSTPQERAAFASGLTYGLQMMGGSAQLLDQKDVDKYEAMEAMAFVKGDPTKMN